MKTDKDFVILLVEDNPAEKRLILEAFKEIQTSFQIMDFKNGEEALDFLELQKNKIDQRHFLLLLDLNLPGKNGYEVLKEIKADEKLRFIPIIIFSTSAYEEHIREAYSLNANAYVVKPQNFEEYPKIMRSIEQFWLKTAVLL